MRGALDRICGVLDGKGTLVACSELSLIGTSRMNVLDHALAAEDTFVVDGYTYKSFGFSDSSDSYVFVEGKDEEAARYAALLSISLGELSRCFDEKSDKNSFLKNLLFDNILPGELYTRSRELMFNTEVDRAVFLVRTSNDSDVVATELLSSIFPDIGGKDYVIGVSETDVVLIKEVRPKTSQKDLEKIGKSITESFNAEYYSKCYVGIGTVSHSIKDLPKAYKEAQVALEVGRVFETEKNIVSYENLGIGRLIYQLPTTLCQMFIDEVFKGGSIYLLDSETLLTIQKFFENNLNVSETARKLFVHRNTLVYRLEKIKKLTGLDIREFDNAITFKVAIMVSRYLSNSTGKF